MIENRSNAEKQLLPGALEDFSTHDPIYFLLGTSPTNAKFQLSFKYRLFGSDDRADPSSRPWHEKFFFAFTQTSFWDLASESKPFRDSNFKPALFYQFDAPTWDWYPGNARSYVRVAFQHESNGKDGDNSRGLNIIYFEPRFDTTLAGGWDISVRPRVWTYVFDPNQKDDFRKYRGNAGLAIGLEKTDGPGLVVSGVANPATGKGNLNLDLSYRLSSAFNLRPYINAQLFTGYGESLLTYNMRETRLRIGLSLTR